MRMVYRMGIYLFGVVVVAVGVVFSVNSQLGVSPASVPPYAVYQTLLYNNVTSIDLGFMRIGLTLGVCMNFVYILYVVVQFIVLGRSFKPVNLLQIAVATVFGHLVDGVKWLMGDFMLPGYGGRLVMLAISIILIAVGLVFYLAPGLLPMPAEGLALAIAKRLKKYPFSTVKMGVDVVFVTSAALITLLGTGSVMGVREGTVITALCTGRLVGLLSKFIHPRLEKLCFGPNNQCIEPPNPEIPEDEKESRALAEHQAEL